MARFPISSAAFTFVATLAFGPVAQLAAQATAPAPAAPNPVTVAPTQPESPSPAAAPAPKRNRAISGDVANMLAQTMPKYAPAPPPPPPPTAAELARKAEEDAADLREIDKPRNGIVRLEKYVVREERPPIFTEREINTKKGIREIAMRRYISDADRAMNRFTLPLFGGGGWSPGSGNGSASEQRALAMYAEDERLKNMSDLADNANMIMKSDANAGATAKDVVQKTYMRSSEFGYGGMSPK